MLINEFVSCDPCASLTDGKTEGYFYFFSIPDGKRYSAKRSAKVKLFCEMTNIFI
jgi:hypothetical protein